ALVARGSPGVYLPGGISEQVDTFVLSHIFGHRNQMQMALATCVFDGVFDRHPRLRMGLLEAGCGLRGDNDAKLNLLGKAKGVYDLLARVEREQRDPAHDAFTFEHRQLDHDPVDFVRAGRVFVSFESDDPAPAYLREALGPM